MSLIRTSLLNVVAVVMRLISAMALNKILAIYLGPAGFAIIGQFQNVVSIAFNLAGGIVTQGVTKGTAEYFDDELKQHAVWKTAIRLSIWASLMAATGLLFAKGWLTKWLFQSTDVSTVFVWLALALPAMVINNILLAIINGKKEVGIYVTVNIIGSLLSLMVTGVLAYYFGLYGALVAFTINPAILLISTSAIVANKEWFRVEFAWGRIDSKALREISGFGVMGLTSAVTVPAAYMLVRDYLGTRLGVEYAGYWQATWKISEIYLMLVTSTLSVYYLPRIAEIRSSRELKFEIFKVYKLVMPIVISGALLIYLLRDFIIEILFTANFSPMRELFPWQVAGDVIKVGSWILAYVMLGRAMIKQFVVTETLFSIFFVILSYLLVDVYGLIGVSIAYAINYCCYLIAMGFLVKFEIHSMENLYVNGA